MSVPVLDLQGVAFAYPDDDGDLAQALRSTAAHSTLVLDDSEVPLRPGSVVVQRGTNHAWANRSGRPCRMLFVLVDGVYDDNVAAALAQR